MIPKTLADRLIDLHELRNQLAHEYPDVRARQVYEAARALRTAVAPFFDALLKWLAKLGFAVPGPSVRPGTADERAAQFA